MNGKRRTKIREEFCSKKNKETNYVMSIFSCFHSHQRENRGYKTSMFFCFVFYSPVDDWLITGIEVVRWQRYIELTWGSPCGAVGNVLDCHVVRNELVLQSNYHIHFRTNALWKVMNSFIPPLTHPSYGGIHCCVESEFELKLLHYALFWTHNDGKGMNSFIPEPEIW